MSKKRVYEIAREQGLSSKELLDRLTAAGVDVKAAASTVEEALALKALGARACSVGELRQKLRARDGYLAIPQEPGLGIDLDEDAIRKYRVA